MQIQNASMKTLSTTKRAAILRCLIEGNSILATARITGAAKNTIIDLLAKAGEACSAYQSKAFVKLPCRVLQLDEVWSFVGCRRSRRRAPLASIPAMCGRGLASALTRS